VREIWISDAGPVIILAKAGYLWLLDRLAEEIWLPSQVSGEIRRGPRSDPARLALDAGWARRIKVAYIPARIRNQVALGRGEQAVLTLTEKHPGCRAILDDEDARKAADRLRLPKIGSLGIILRAKQQGIIPAAVPAATAILKAGIHLSPAFITATLAAIGETWP
jgi:predicted nucleic acid-binding protein